MKRVATFFLAILITLVTIGVNTYADEKTDFTGNSFVSKYSEYLNNCLDFSAGEDKEVYPLNNEEVVLERKGDIATFNVDVEQNSIFCPEIEYLPISKSGSDITVSLFIDGEIPCESFRNFKLSRQWQDAEHEILADDYGNEFSPEQVEIFAWQKTKIIDSYGIESDYLKIGLSKGTHVISLVLSDEACKIKCIYLKKPEPLKKFNEISFGDVKKYDGEVITVEGESATTKSSSLIVSKTDRSDPSVQPSNAYIDKINYIGGSNWKNVGDTINWEIDVPETALYNLTFHYKQTYLQEDVSFRKLLVDGECPFYEVSNISFPYNSGWQYLSLSDIKNSSLYLTKGKHTISLTITLGSMSEFASSLRQVTSDLGETYRKIVMITGESPDSNRDYNLFEQLPDLEKKLKSISASLNQLAKESEVIAGSKGGTNASTLRKCSIVIDKMLETKYKAHTRVSSLYDNYSSLASWLYEMQDMALDLDALFLSEPNSSYRRNVSVFDHIWYSISRLFSSFSDDYNSLKKEEKSITVWCNSGRDQVSVLDSLINSSFRPKTGIDVNIRITTASVIQANLSGNGPDIMMNVSRSSPVNYAIRNAAYDISKFSDYNDVINEFSSSAMIPYEYNNGVYGLPSTQSFYMLFVRTDIFEELGISIPKTWDDFIAVSKVIYLNNMQVAIPYTQVTNAAVNLGVGALTLLPTIACQYGVSLYNSDNTKTNLDTPEMLKAATVWTDFYTKYKLPKTYNFFNRFRTGTIPMAIQDFSLYATVSAAAPEIKGKWTMLEIPGVLKEDGSIDNRVSGSGGASVILSQSKDKESAWEFLKWYSSEDIQYRFSKNLESVLGVSARRPTANIKALMRLGWEDSIKVELEKQIKKIEEIPEIPGSYYVSRSIDQIYWNVTAGSSVQDMLKKWGAEADNEISRKIEEYPINK